MDSGKGTAFGQFLLGAGLLPASGNMNVGRHAMVAGFRARKYDELLASHDIDLAVVPDLAEQDLEKLGLSLGHRRKFFAAAAKLRGAAAFPDDAASQIQSFRSAGAQI
jgi:hypothetical protein